MTTGSQMLCIIMFCFAWPAMDTELCCICMVWLQVKESSFRRFLVDTPLVRKQASMGPDGHSPAWSYGSYHQQYWIDGECFPVSLYAIVHWGVAISCGMTCPLHQEIPRNPVWGVQACLTSSYLMPDAHHAMHTIPCTANHTIGRSTLCLMTFTVLQVSWWLWQCWMCCQSA